MVPAAAAAAPVAPVQAAPQSAAPAAPPQPGQGDGIGGAHPIRLSLSERARTVTYVATAATLGTFSPEQTEAPGTPFGSYVDYILDDKGWPVLLLSEQSLHTQNIKANPRVSLFVQMPRTGKESTSAALSRVTLIGRIVPVEEEELSAIRTAYSIVHSYSERLVDSPKFSFYKVRAVRFGSGLTRLSSNDGVGSPSHTCYKINPTAAQAGEGLLCGRLWRALQVDPRRRVRGAFVTRSPNPTSSPLYRRP